METLLIKIKTMENNLFFDIFGTIVFGAIGVVCLWKGIEGISKPLPKCDNAFDCIMKKAGWPISVVGTGILLAIAILWFNR